MATARKKPVEEHEKSLGAERKTKPSAKFAGGIEELLKKITPETYMNLPEETAIKLRKTIADPYGTVIPPSESDKMGETPFLTLSMTDLEGKHKEMLIITGFIGFLNQACDEWEVPKGLPIIPVEEYQKDPSTIDPPLNKEGKIAVKGKVLEAYQENWKQMQKRCIVKEFLAFLFQYNPNNHVRSAYKPNLSDKERKILDTPAAQLAIKKETKRNPVFREKKRQFDKAKEMRKKFKKPEETPTTPTETAQQSSEDPTKSIKKTKAAKKQKKVKKQKKAETSEELRESETYKTVTEMIPPADLFERFTRYFESNYDALRIATNDLYCYKPMFEKCIVPHRWHPNSKSADDFIEKYRNDFVHTIMKVEAYKWSIIAPFKEVRKNMSCYTDDTVIFKEMIDQQERDNRLGRDLMNKAKAKAKKKNIEEEGPHSKKFEEWKKSNSILSKMGGGGKDPNKESYADDDCPEDGIQVNYFTHHAKTGEFTKGRFFTEAEAPEWVDESTDKPTPDMLRSVTVPEAKKRV